MKKIKKYHLRKNIKDILIIGSILLIIISIFTFWVEYRLPQLEKNEKGVIDYGN